MRSFLTTLLKIVVSVGLIIYLLSGVQIDEMWRIISGASIPLLLVALALYLGAIVVGAAKWNILLRALGISVPLRDVVSYSFAGLFFGNVLPTNVGGDLVRGYDLARHTGLVEQSAISVLIDRLVGLAAFLAAAVVMAVVAALTLADAAAMETIVVAVVAVFALFIASFSLLLSRRVMRRTAFLFKYRLLSPFKPMAQRVFVALQVYRHAYGALARGFVLSLCVVVLTALTQWVISEALGLGISLFHFMLFNPLIAFVLLVPLSVNGIGLKEAAFVFFLGLVGVPQAAAFALSIVFHFIIVVSSLPGGFVWFRERSAPPIMTDSEDAPAEQSHPA